jgi:serine/threonine protein kinase/tetratricopeptide (TPR) repeat protein
MPLDPNRVQTVFLAAVQAADREAVLARECVDDDELRRRVEALLQAHDQPGSLLDQPAAADQVSSDVVPGRFIDPADAPRLAEGPGSRIGPYKLLQLLGEGGMGAVYMAEQEEPVKRRVALKIIKAGLDSARVIARFEQERQALAMMDHPNIAKVLDAGTIEAHGPPSVGLARPYFVMELVKGIPITKFCDQEHLTPKERLELFVPVCHAVQHAHQKGIIHRDIKPSNVLIALYDGKPVPKVIDFGVAKATAQKLTEKTMFTEVGQIVGTLEYMAPEQAELNNLDIDTRADIYSLGVLLYELLTGSPPFTSKQLRSAAFDEMLRIIREVEPPKPSTKLSSTDELPAIAALRKLEPSKLAKLVKGDLDWIVMKALEKDRGRRYETANGLAMDVQRYLADEPVLASPPSAGYRLRKFVRKNRGPVLAASIIAVLLLCGIIGTSFGFLHADRLRQVAEKNEQEAREEKSKAETYQQQAMDALKATTDDVIEHLLGSKPLLGPAEKAFLQSTLKRWQTLAAEQGDSERARAIRAEGVFRVAFVRRNLGQDEQARAGFEEAIELLERLAVDFPAVPKYRNELAAGYVNLGIFLNALGKRAEAEAAYRKGLSGYEKLATEFTAEPLYRQGLGKSYNNLGPLLRNWGKLPEAEAAYRQATSTLEKLATDYAAVAEYRHELAASQNNLAILLHNLGKRPEAEAACRQALNIREKLVNDNPAVPSYRNALAVSHGNLANMLADSRKAAEAEAAYRRAINVQKELVADYPAMPQYRLGLAANYNNLGILCRDVGKLPEAEAAHRQALAIREKLATEFPTIPEYRMDLGGSQGNIGRLERSKHQPEKALQWYAKSIDTIKGVLRQVKVNATALRILRNGYAGQAQALDDLKRHADAVLDWDKAVELSPETERPQFRMDRALSRVRAGQVDAALQEATDLAKIPDPRMLYNAACVFALAAGRKDEPSGSLSKEDCAKRAIALLQQAVAKGYKDVDHMKKDDDLKALRELDDFKKLVAELEAANAKKP